MNDYRRLLGFEEHVKREAANRQQGYCAYCNQKLASMWFEGTAWHAHHVIPVQTAEQLENISDDMVRFFRSTDNCVLLCGANENNVGFGGCHLRAGHGGNTREVIAPPSVFAYSHRGAPADREFWLKKLELKWRLLFGKTSSS